jgi:hypothetical protein
MIFRVRLVRFVWLVSYTSAYKARETPLLMKEKDWLTTKLEVCSNRDACVFGVRDQKHYM